jgi:hypothetical protein
LTVDDPHSLAGIACVIRITLRRRGVVRRVATGSRCPLSGSRETGLGVGGYLGMPPP